MPRSPVAFGLLLGKPARTSGVTRIFAALAPWIPALARAVGEVPIVPPMAAVANAINDAIGIRMRDLPMSPPRLRAAIDAQQPMRRAAE